MATNTQKDLWYRLIHSSGEFVFRDIATARKQLALLPGAKLFIVNA